MHTSNRTLALLVAGAAAGVVLAASGLGVKPKTGADSLPPGVVARVNGEAIPRSLYERALARLGSGADEDARRRVLERLVQEELLVQRGLELGFARSDRRVRGNLTKAVVDSVLERAHQSEPSEEPLRDFYRTHESTFARPGPMRLDAIFFRTPETPEDPSALPRALRAKRRIDDGESFESVHRSSGDAMPVDLKDAPMTPSEIRDRLGAAVVRAVRDLEAGAVTRPLRIRGGYVVVRVVERSADRVPPFGEIREEVRAEYVRRAGDRALREYLEDLRARADVEIAESLP